MSTARSWRVLLQLTAVLDTIIRQNENTLEQLNQYRVCVENIQKSLKEKQEVEDTLSFSGAEKKPRLALGKDADSSIN